MKPPLTRMTHTLPFEKLGAAEFERLCLWLVSREGYTSIEALGEAGADQGRDLVAWKGDRRVAFQCKRVRKFGPRQAKAEVLKVIELPAEQRPVELFFLVTCAVSDRTRREAKKIWGKSGGCNFWTGHELDHKVKQHPDIVEQFFDLGNSWLERDHGGYLQQSDNTHVRFQTKGLAKKTKKLLTIAVASLAVTSLLYSTYIRQFKSPVISPTSKVLVLPFTSIGTRPVEPWLSKASQHLISLNLGDAVQLVSENELEGLEPPLVLPQSFFEDLDKDARNSLSRLGAPDTRFVVWGTYETNGQRGDTVRATIHIQQINSNRQFRPKTIRRIKLDNIIEGVLRISETIAETLGLDTLQQLSPLASTSNAESSSSGVSEGIAHGLEKLEALEYKAASAFFSGIVGEYPRNMKARVALAEALWGLGDYRAKEQVEAALRDNQQLDLTTRILLDAISFETEGKWAEASALYNTLWHMKKHGVDPDRFKHGVLLARCQMKRAESQSDPQGWAASQDTITTLASLAQTDTQRARASLLQLEFHFRQKSKISNKKSDLSDAATEAIGLAEKAGARMIAAESKYYWGSYLLAEDKNPSQAISLLDESLDAYSEAAHERRIADILFKKGKYYQQTWELDKADLLNSEAQTHYNSIGAVSMERIVAHNRALIRRHTIGYDEEIKSYNEFLKNFDGPESSDRKTLTLFNTVIPLSARGRFREAEAALEEANEILRVRGKPETDRESTLGHYVEGRLRMEQGKLTEATSALRLANSSSGSPFLRERVQLALAEAFLDYGNIEGAESELRQVYDRHVDSSGEEEEGLPFGYHILHALLGLAKDDLELAKSELEISKTSKVFGASLLAQAEVQLVHARVFFAEGNLAEAEGLLRDTILKFSERKAEMAQAEAHILLAEVLAGQVKLPEAQSEITKAKGMVQNIGAAILECSLGLAEAKLRALSQEASARFLLGEVCQNTSTQIGIRWQLEADFARLEVSKILGRKTESGEVLKWRERALEQGLELLAKNGEKLLENSEARR